VDGGRKEEEVVDGVWGGGGWGEGEEEERERVKGKEGKKKQTTHKSGSE